MVTIKRILFPIDFSDCSYDVAPYVLSMIEKLILRWTLLAAHAGNTIVINAKFAEEESF